VALSHGGQVPDGTRAATFLSAALRIKPAKAVVPVKPHLVRRGGRWLVLRTGQRWNEWRTIAAVYWATAQNMKERNAR
jgi:hypothetical protein